MTMLAVAGLMYFCQDSCYILFSVLALAFGIYFQWIFTGNSPLDVFQRWKFLWCLRKSKKKKKTLLLKPDPYGRITDLAIPTEHDASLEGKQKTSGSSISFHGVDVDSGSSLSIKIFSRNSNQAKAFLHWNDKESGETFSLIQSPESSYVVLEQSCENKFIAAGIHLTVLEPMRRWRIQFNGMLRKETNGDVVHVRMNLIWSALHSPFDWSSDVSIQPIAQALSKSKLNQEDAEKLYKAIHPHGYDQWGAMFGEIIFSDPNDEEKKIYMRGLRERRLQIEEEGDKIESKNEFEMIGITENGFFFVVRQKKYQNKSTASGQIGFNFGHMLIPGRNIFPITELEMPNFEWHQDLLEKNHFAVQQDFARIKAGDRWFNIGVQTRRRISVTENMSIQFETNLIQSDLTFNCRRGRALCFSRTKRLEKIKNEESNFETFEEAVLDKNGVKAVVVALNSSICTSSLLTGGKASSLALMLQSKQNIGENVVIPLGVCVTTFGLDKQLTDLPQLKGLIQQVEDQTSKLNCAQSEQERLNERKLLEEACKRAVEAISTNHLADSVSSAIFKELETIFPNGDWADKKFAVRSSAVGEDSSDLSSAGQNETFLGCCGKNRIEKAVVQCWASLFAFQSVEYRRQNGQPVQTGMAVVIQEMVAAEAAGVLFTRDPINGDPSKIVITANFGLGESVVSASSDPDTLVVKNEFWKSKNQLTFESCKIGAKSTRIDMASDSGTTEEKVDLDNANRSCLNETFALRLSQLGINLEKKFGSPRDIEFAVKGEIIYLLQSRPITSLSVWSDDDLLHEFDSATFSSEDISTKANLGEVIPGATSPLTNSLMLQCLDVSIQKMMLEVPGNLQAFCSYARRMIPVSNHHCFFNYLDCCLPQVESEDITAQIMAVDLAVFGHQVTSKEAIQCAMDRRGMGTRITGALRLTSVAKTILKTVYWQKYGLSSVMTQPLFDLKKLEWMDAKQIYNEINRAADIYVHTCFNHSRVSEASTVFQLIIFLTLAENAPVSEWSTDLFADAANLLASDAGDVVSAGCPTELKHLSDAIWRNQAEDQPFALMSAQDAESWLKTNSKVSALYQSFLQKFGHRCLREFDMSSKPWCEDQNPLLSTLQAMVASKSGSKNSEETKETTKESTKQKLDTLQKAIKPGTRKALNFLLPYAHGGVALREHSKSLLIKQCHEVRSAYRILAQKLCSNGLLPELDLIYYITHPEIKELIEKRSPTIVQKSIRRRRLRNVWDELRFKEMNHGVPKPLDYESSLWLSQATDSTGLTVAHGTPVCRGRYRGVAKVITRLADAASIRQGDILITVSTDIGWSPYFPLLGGVSTELGGLISHGAVVAREYGLPCVVGVEGATAIFKTGDIVEIDGAKGTITKCPTD